MACYILQIEAGARVNDNIIEQKCLILASGGLSNGASASAVASIRRGFNLPVCPLALSRKGHVSNNNLDFTLAKGAS